MNQGSEIERLVQGETPSLLDAEKGNEVIDAINPLQKIEIQRKGTSDFVSYSDNNVLINLQEMPEEGGGDLTGFSEHQIYVCINGNASLRTILIKDQ